jgi:putative tricarboxylic transport membrane protein
MLLRGRLRRSAAYAVILCCAAYLYYLTQHFQFEFVPGRVGPDAWPKIVLVLLLATCIWQIARILIFGAAPTASADDELPLVEGEGDYTHLALLAIGVTVIYAFLLPTLGFLVATVLYIAGVTYVGRYRRFWPLVATSIIAPIVLVFVFMKIVYVALPLGVGPFKTLTLALLKVLGVH